MKRMLLVVAAAGMLCSACASSPENLQRETARFIGGTIPQQVTVSNINRGATNVSWDAETPKGKYGCNADDMLRRVLCVKQ